MTIRLPILEAMHEWDVETFSRIVSRPSDCQLLKIARWVSRTGDGYLYPLVPLVIALAGFSQPLIFLKMALAAFGIERVIYLLAKNSFKRRRPANILPGYHSIIIASDEFSFPSGHSSAAFLMVTLIVVTYGAQASILYLWAGSVACSRVLLGVHFPTDIIVGATLGASIAVLTSSSFL